MTDVREAILARMVVILQSIDDVETVVRNRGLLDNDERPALALLDGSESVSQASDQRRGRRHFSPTVVTMRPQVFGLLKSAPPANAGVGTSLNTLRMAVLRALAADVELRAIIGGNGEISYLGMETDLQTGRSLSGEFQLTLLITYVMNPYKE